MECAFTTKDLRLTLTWYQYGSVERVYIARDVGSPVPVFVKFTSPLSALRVSLETLELLCTPLLTIYTGCECPGGTDLQRQRNISSVLRP